MMAASHEEAMTLPSPTHAEIADVLIRAAGVIADRGWTQENYEDRDGKVCLVGSVCYATDVPFFQCNVDHLTVACSDALLTAINASSSNQWTNSEDWNDWPQRDAREVIDLLEGVAWQHSIKAEAEAQKDAVLVG